MPLEPPLPGLFEEASGTLPLGEGAVVLGGFAIPSDHALLAALADVLRAASFRHLTTPGGRRMSVGMTNCGRAGWISDATGYRYVPADPVTGRCWPAMPRVFSDVAAQAADKAGFPAFTPDACLINRYVPNARLSLHQDRNEIDYDSPIVSVSLGLPAVFLWGGLARSERPRRVPLVHGDVVVWGGPARLNFHGVDPLRDGTHDLTGVVRYNLTFRRAL
jgi:alkylated DNA repair protein (DNA oxidative demethylase)